MDDKEFLKLTDDLGNIQEYEILTTFKRQSNGKNYVVYTDNSKDGKGNLNIYAGIFYPNDNTKLDNIETEEEWDMIEKILTKEFKGN